MRDGLEKLGRSTANSSGFPLQIRVADVVNSSGNWKVLADEYPWQFEKRGLEGFIDIVAVDATHGIQVMVVECKRVKDTAWVFLVPQKNPKMRSYIKLWISNRKENDNWTHFGWETGNVDPQSYESKFCAVQGSRQGRQTLLERTATDLLDSVEAFAFQEKRSTVDPNFTRFYVPIIVTTAELIVSYFEPGSISLKDGSLPKNAVFETVPYVRFRKSFRDMSLRDMIIPVQQAYRESERTVFIVNAEHWKTFLYEWEIQGGPFIDILS